MISSYKELLPEFQSIRPYKMYSTWELTEANIGTGSSDIKVYDAFYTQSMTDQKEAPEDIYDSHNYLLTYNYDLYGGDKYMPISESLNADGTSKRMVWYAINRSFYSPEAIHQQIFTTASLGDEAIVFSIPQSKFGETIKKETFILTETSDTANQPYSSSDASGLIIEDDGWGNLFDTNNANSSSLCVGNISYNTGIAVITDSEYYNYFINTASLDSLDIDLRYTSYHNISEHEFTCVVGAKELNATQNPTYYDDGSDDPDGIKRAKLIKEAAGEGIFHVYITSIGIYDETNRLVAVGKFAKPIPKENKFDSVFIVRIDI